MKKAALITGSADRIGRAIALALADKGFDIALHYSSSDVKANETKNEILKKNVRCSLFKADFNKPDDIISMYDDASGRFKIEVLVNSASVFYESSLNDSNFSSIDNFINVNLKAPYLLTKLFAVRSQKGLIINLLDAVITKNSGMNFDYLLSKKSLAEFTKMSAKALGPDIRVNAIAPGIILPPKGKGIDYINNLALNIPLKRPGSIENITETVNFFITNDYITGQIIFVDGGMNL
jgi:NAD(P)-dependent dehydrogenase (short-subunit alcohol dehydrogenase family)